MSTSELPFCRSHPVSRLFNRLHAHARVSFGISVRLAGLAFAATLLAPLTHAQSNYATPYFFTTLAGVALASGSTDGTGTAAKFFQPHGIAVDANGVVYVADLNNQTIRKITPFGVVTTFAGTPGIPGSNNGTGTGARFNSPRGVAVDTAGNLYVADSQNYMIRKITPAGVVTTLAGSNGVGGSRDGTGTGALFISPDGLAVDLAGNVYVADVGNHAIRKITPGGVVTTLAGGLSPTLSGTADGTGGAARFSSPFGVAVDPSGNVYVADRDNYKIRKITPDGVVTSMAGLTNFISADTDGTGTAARFAQVVGVAADASGNVYVVDSTNSTIRKVTAAGVVTTLAGLTRFTGSTDGTGSAVRFNSPQGIAVDALGNLYVSDTINHTIRMSVFPPVFTTHPQGDVVTPGGNWSGTATVVTNVPATFQWLKDGAPFSFAATGISFNITNGAAAGSPPNLAATKLDLSNIRTIDQGNYTVVATNMAGSTTSNIALVSFTPPPSNYATPYYFTTLAGANDTGSNDGTGRAARFFQPGAVAADSNDNAYVADSNNNTIRKISPIGIVTTIAGTAGPPGLVNGTGSAARFNSPRGVAVTASGSEIYVADTSNHVIRKITAGGVVTTLAGGTIGFLDGTGTQAQFAGPWGIAVDRNGFVYVSSNSAIRKISPGGVVTTLAGNGSQGNSDGIGTTARFKQPLGVAVDAAGDNIYVADSLNNSIRKITAAGVVTTLAGALNGTAGSSDGIGNGARFDEPDSVAVDVLGNVYVTDGNATIRRIAPNGEVTTLAGLTRTAGVTDGRGSAARFILPEGIAIDGSGNLYVADVFASTIRMSVVPPFVLGQPTAQTVAQGTNVTLRADGFSNAAITYQWLKNGVPIAGATNSTPITGAPLGSSSFLTLTGVQPGDLGNYSVVMTNVAGSTTSSTAALAFVVSTAGRLVNLSILTTVAAGGDNFSMGYVVGGSGTTGTKPLVIRAAGPALGALGVPGTLDDPKIELFAGATKTDENDNWGGSATIANAMAAVGAFAFTVPTSRDAAFVANITQRDNSVKVSAVGTGSGSVLAEIYDATPGAGFTPSTPRLINVSVIKNIGPGLSAGFVIGGATPMTVLIRAVGPTLGSFGVGGVIADPQLALFKGTTKIGENNDWGGAASLAAAFTQVGAFVLPATSKDAALLMTLPAGDYSVQVTGVGGTSGTALVEVYEVP